VTASYFFYDLETSGLSPQYHRVLQFAGQRTDLQLNPIGPAINRTVRLDPDVVPEPGAIAVHGITPQATLAGISERELCELLHNEVATPGTAMVGYNNFHFDDEVLRNTLWRNFYDPYEWAWKDGRSRWDAILVTKMFRELRPGAVAWPTCVGDDGEERPDTRLESLCAANGIVHRQVHDALSDVQATIAWLRLLRESNERLFEHAIKLRNKADVVGALKAHMEYHTPFLLSGPSWTDGRVTTVAVFIEPFDSQGEALVYDLTRDPSEFVSLSEAEMSERLFRPRAELEELGLSPLPVQRVRNNRQLGVSPIKVAEIDPVLCERLGIELALLPERIDRLRAAQSALARVRTAFAKRSWPDADDVEGQLYKALIPFSEKRPCALVRSSAPGAISDEELFYDERLRELLFRYRARNARDTLSPTELERWLAQTAERGAITPEWESAFDEAWEAGDETARAALQALRAWTDTPYLERG
jgi:exodeoxyribonuclease I